MESERRRGRRSGRGGWRRLLAAAGLAGSLAAGTAGEAAGQGRHLLPGDSAWSFAGEAEVRVHEGEEVLYLRRGRALRRDVSFSEGTISFEMLPTDRRAFLGVLFRVPEGDGSEADGSDTDGSGADGNGTPAHVEDIYLRLHKSGLPDAVQYSPDYRGRGQWQLYHGPTATAAAGFEAGRWQPVRIEVKGRRAAVFVGRDPRPRLVVDRLRAGTDRGGVGFWGNFPGAGEGDPPTALLRDIRVRPGEISGAFPSGDESREPAPAPVGVVRAWGVSAPFVRPGDAVLRLPGGDAVGPWIRVETEPSGLLPLDRHRERPEGGAAAVLAGLRLRADRERTVRLDLGFSDDASVFLNGRLLYSGKFGFSHNFPRRQGLITLDQASLYLPLEAGDNRLVIAVSEVFGGWGLMARIRERDGLGVRPLDGF